MTLAAIVERLAAEGFDDRDLQTRCDLFDRVLQAFGAAAGGAPAYACWVPGRLEVFGKHTDYAGGHSLVCAVPRGFAVAARARTDGRVRLLDALRGEECVIDGAAARESAAPSTGWRNYAHVVVRRLARNFPGAALDADVVFASDLPSASGMSSSSALVTGLAAALAARAGLHSRDEWRANVRGPVGVASYVACIENGMRFGTLEGDAGVGTHGGSEDHAAIVCGRAGELTAWRFVPMVHVADVALPEDWTFVVAASGVAARKAGEAREAYNRLSREADMLREVWARHAAAVPSLGAALASDPGVLPRLQALLRRSDLEASMAEALARRLTHLVREDARVPHALAAFATADEARVAALAESSQDDAEALLRNQVPETIHLARSARALGAMAASSFGAGFGGSVWALTRREDAPAFAARWLDEYRTRFPSRAAATVFAMRPGPGLTGVL